MLLDEENDMRNAPLQTIQKLIKERYSVAKVVFWAGSVSKNQGTKGSDLDLVIVYEKLPHAYREAFIYEGWPIDAFIHDPDTLRYFTKKLEAGDGRPALIQMILNGYEVLGQNDFSRSIKLIAQEALTLGPDEWSQAQLDRERFLITDILDDIKFPKNWDEQVISAVHLFEPLIQFYFRAQKKWAASGKSLMRYLKVENPDLALEFNQSFERLFQVGEATGIESVVQKILAPYGGLLWDGFRSDAPKEWKSAHESDVLEELKTREQIFHHPDKFGKSEQHVIVRQSQLSDIETLVLLSNEKRLAYEKAQPQFWRYAGLDGDNAQAQWFKELLTHKDYLMLTAEDANHEILGFVRS